MALNLGVVKDGVAAARVEYFRPSNKRLKLTANQQVCYLSRQQAAA
jgi:hypothetical protein